MVASDRYGRRDMALFDLVLTRFANAMDYRLRRVMGMALIRAGAREEHVKLALEKVSSPNGRFLRRCVTQTKQDLYTFLLENAEGETAEGDETLSDGNGLTLPHLFAHWLYQYQATVYAKSLEPKIGKDRAKVLIRTAERFRHEIIESSTRIAREEVVAARRTVKDWVKRRAVTDDLLAELLEARAMTELIFALMNMLEIDCSTTIRLLNDITFESFAVAAKAKDIRRSVFAKTVNGFKFRKTDERDMDRILKLYDQLSIENAERAMRFWQVRVANINAEEPAIGLLAEAS